MSDYCKIEGMDCAFVLGDKKCLIDKTCKYMNEWLIEHDKQIRANAQDELPTRLYVDGFNDGYEKGRTDAIDECIETINSWVERQNCFKGTLKYISKNIFEELEKIKEQK